MNRLAVLGPFALHVLDLAWHALLVAWTVLGALTLLAIAYGITAEHVQRRRDRHARQAADVATARALLRELCDDQIAACDLTLWELEAEWTE